MADDKEAAPGTYVRDTPTGMSRSQVAAALVAAAALVWGGLHTIQHFIPALAWAAVIAIGVWPHYEKLARRFPKAKSELLPALAILCVLLVFVVPITLVAVPAASDAHSLAQWVQDVRAHGLQPPGFLQNLPYGPRLVDLWRSKVGQPGALSDLASHNMQGGLVHFGRKVGAEAIHRLVLLGFMLLALFFLLRDADGVVAQLKVGSRRAFGPAGEDVGRQMIRSVNGTVNGLVLVGLGVGIIMGVVYAVAGTPHATLFGLITAILAMVPFGMSVALAVAGLVLLAVNKVVAAIVVVVVGMLISFAADHFIRPALIGGATKLPFIWVLFGILGGVETFGLVGLFIGPAILAALILLWREWVGAKQGPINPSSTDASAALPHPDATPS
jgi:predicted PurR-regulated permease PerM